MIINDLTTEQKDYAVFLPSISGFYATFIGKQRYGNYVDPTRFPKRIGSMEALNFLNPKEASFNYKWALYSAGHADLDTTKFVEKEDMIRNRNRETSWLLGDSGGFQVAKGIWKGDWTSPTCPLATKKRELVVNWMEAYMDYGMMLDIPTWTYQDTDASEATNIRSYNDAVKATHINADYYLKNRRGNFKVLNVLQGSNHTNAEDWYQEFKDYCDPKKYPSNHFNGWAMGGQNMCDVHLILIRLVHMIHDGLLEPGLHDVMHFLGTSKLEWAVLLTDIQRSVRKYHNPNFMITYDCASPFLATANGQIYYNIRIDHNDKWSYMMAPSIDDKKYATDTRKLSDVFLTDSHFNDPKKGKIPFPNFEDSPISDVCNINDICIYKPGDLNKQGREGKTSWDSFSYALQMGHNVWMHITSTQRSNKLYDEGLYPNMMIYETPTRRDVFRDIVDEIFSHKDRQKSLATINKYGTDIQPNSIWTHIIGTRLKVGKKTINAEAKYTEFFE